MFSKLHPYRMQILIILLPLLCLAIPGAAPARADTALLANGFRLRVAGKELQGASVRLFIPGGGYVDVRPSEIIGFEPDEAPVPSLPLPPPEPAPAPAAPHDHHGLDPVLVQSMIAEESGFNARAVSPKGAAGLMQLMPGTARDLRVSDVFDPGQNVEAGARYLRSLLERYKGDLAKALAAYNAGPGAVDRHRGIPPYRETRNYVRRVLTRFNREKTANTVKK